MSTVFISIGSNTHRRGNISSAVKTLRHEFMELTLSAVYESPAMGFKGNSFYNLAAAFETSLNVWHLRERLRRIEDEHHRDRSTGKFSDRTLDIDLLLYGNLVINENGLELPRGEILEYAFVLKPLADIAGEVLHPTKNETIAHLWSHFHKVDQTLAEVPFNFPNSSD